MKKITLYLLLCFPSVFFSQRVAWVKTPEINFHMNPEYIGYVSAVDISGNAYLAGFKDGAFPYNEIMGNVYYTKYSASGDLIFSKTFNGHGSVINIASDSVGNTLLVVGYINTITVGDLSLQTVFQDVQPLLLKFNPRGDLIWHFEPQTDGVPAAWFKAIALDSSDNIYIGYNDYEHSYVTKLTPDGTAVFSIVQQHVRAISSISVDNAGNIYCAGSCSDSNSVYAGVAKPAPFSYNTYIVKYSSNGIFQWIKYVEDVTCPHPEVKAVSPDAVYFSSSLNGAFSFDSFVSEEFLGNPDAFVTKLNADGNFQWLREVNGAGDLAPGNRNFLNIDQMGNVYFCGRTRGTIFWSPEIMTNTTGYNNDAILLKYNSDGDVLMAQTVGGDLEDRFDGITVALDGTIYVSGMASGNATFGNFTHEADEFSYYPFIAKIENNNLSVISARVDPVGICPNPARNAFYISGIKGKTKGTLINSIGQQVQFFETDGSNPIDISNLANGIYTVQIGTAVLKMVKE